jgi:hypothetical protein
MSDLRYMKNRFNIAVSDPNAKYHQKEYNDKILREVYALLQEDMEFNPSNYKFLANIILDCPFLGKSQRLTILRKLYQMGILVSHTHYSQTIDFLMLYHDTTSLEVLAELEICVTSVSFISLMTGDEHLPFLQSMWHLFNPNPGIIRKCLSAAIECRAWKILDFLISPDHVLPQVSNIHTTYSASYSIVFSLVQTGEEMFLKYHKALREKFSINKDEEIKSSIDYCVKHRMPRAFGELFDYVHSYMYTSRVMTKIIDEQADDLLFRISADSFRPRFVLRMILAKWFLGVKVLIGLIKMYRIDVRYDSTVRRWFHSSYAPRIPEKIQIFMYLQMTFPDFYQRWHAEREQNRRVINFDNVLENAFAHEAMNNDPEDN